MKNKHRMVIDKYTQPIYSVSNIYVIKYADIELLAKRFYLEGLTEDDIFSTPACTIYDTSERSTDIKCTLVILNVDQLKTEVKALKNKYILVNTFAHEALHVAFDMLNRCNIKLEGPTEECFAYLIGWITECITKSYNKK